MNRRCDESTRHALQRGGRIRGALTATVAATLVLTLAATGLAQESDGPTIRIVALPGDAPEGLAEGRVIRPAPDPEQIAISGAGRVLFNANVYEADGTTYVYDALFSGGARATEQVVATTTAPPAGELPLDGFKILNFATRWLTPSGTVVTELFLRNGSTTREAYFTWVERELAIGAIQFFASPGICGLADLGNGIESQSFGLNDDVLVFMGPDRFDVCPDPEDAIYRRIGSDNPVTLARTGEATGLAANSTWTRYFRQPGVSQDGAALFPGRITVDQVGTFDVLALAPRAGGIQLVSGSQGKAPGTTLDHVTFDNWAFGPPDVPERVVYTVNAGAKSVFGATQTDHLIYDTTVNSGATPIIRTGDSHGTFTFAAVPASFQRTLFTFPARAGRVIVIGKTTSSDASQIVGTDAQGVWRYDPATTPQLQLVIHEGSFVTDLNGAQRRVTSLISVDVNEHGHIACEALLDSSSSNQAILLEKRDEPGSFVVALQRRDDVPTDEGPREMSGIFGQLRNFPIASGPGFSGRCGRFNADGLYVFSGTVVFDAIQRRTAIYTISIEKQPELCDVAVRVNRGNLDIRGGKEGCRIAIEGDGTGGFTVTPGEHTSINGLEVQWSGEATRSVKIRMGEGDDRVTFTSSDIAGDQASGDDVLRNLSIDLGAGSDTLIMRDVQVAGSTKIATGNGIIETVDIDDCEFVRNLDMRGGDGQSLFDLEASATVGKTSIALGNGGQSRVTLTSGFFHTTTLRGGTSFDTIAVRDCTFSGRTTIDPGRGALDNLILMRNEHEDGGLVINAKRCDTVEIYSEDLTIEERGLRMTTGKAGCKATFIRAIIDGITTIKTSGTATGGLNDIDLDNSFLEELKLRGKGNHEVTAAMGAVYFGASISVKGGTLDSFHFTRQEFDEGAIKIQSKATELASVHFRDCDVEDGDITVKTGKGNDQVLFVGGILGSDINVKTGSGDDEIIMNSLAADDVRVDGGPGTDIDRVDDDLQVDSVTKKNLE